MSRGSATKFREPKLEYDRRTDVANANQYYRQRLRRYDNRRVFR